MVSETNFIVRLSGRRVNSYYIDYLGVYKVMEIAKISGLTPATVKDIYLNNGSVYDDTQDVYYFDSIEAAKKAISDILGKVKMDHRGRLIFLSEAEVELIRRALINEGNNTIHMKNKVKDAIFKKLND